MYKAIGHETVYVSFSFGSMVYVGVTLYEGLSFEECLRMRDEDIDGYIMDGKYHKI